MVYEQLKCIWISFSLYLPLLTHLAAEVICKILRRTIKHSEQTPGIIVWFLRGFSSRTAMLELTARRSTIAILFWILKRCYDGLRVINLRSAWNQIRFQAWLTASIPVADASGCQVKRHYLELMGQPGDWYILTVRGGWAFVRFIKKHVFLLSIADWRVSTKRADILWLGLRELGRLWWQWLQKICTMSRTVNVIF